MDYNEAPDGTTFGIEVEKRSYDTELLAECDGAMRIARRGAAEAEFKSSVFEMVSGIWTIDGLWDQLRAIREGALLIAADDDCLPLDSSMPLNGPPGGCGYSPHDRYLVQAERLRGLADPSPTGIHVHVNVIDVDKRVEVRDRMSSYEHLLVALSAGSPFEDGFNKRMASVRTERFGSLETAFDPLFTDSYEAHLDHLRVHLRALGYIPEIAEPDVFRFAHPRTRVSTDGKPTVEVRTLENGLTMDDQAWFAYISIGLANRILNDIEDGKPPAARRDVHLEHRAMRKHAQNFGMTTTLHDPTTMEKRPAWEVADDFFTYIQPGLWRADPTGHVVAEFRELTEGVRLRGTGAERLLQMHNDVYRWRLQRGERVANYDLWNAGREAMTEGTAQELTAYALLLHFRGGLRDSMLAYDGLVKDFMNDPANRLAMLQPNA